MGSSRHCLRGPCEVNSATGSCDDRQSCETAYLLWSPVNARRLREAIDRLEGGGESLVKIPSIGCVRASSQPLSTCWRSSANSVGWVVSPVWPPGKWTSSVPNRSARSAAGR